MKKIKDLKILVVGAFAVLMTVGLNFRHALNDYGVLENSLHVEVLAQSNGTTGGGTIGGNSNSSSTDGGSTNGLREGFKKNYTGEIVAVPSYGELECFVESTSMNACNFDEEAFGCKLIDRRR